MSRLGTRGSRDTYYLHIVKHISFPFTKVLSLVLSLRLSTAPVMNPNRLLHVHGFDPEIEEIPVEAYQSFLKFGQV